MKPNSQDKTPNLPAGKANQALTKVPASTTIPEAKSRKNISIKVFGVGGAGGNMVEQMIKSGFSEVSFAVFNTDAESLENSSATQKLRLESKLLRGLGTGGDPDLGRAAAEEHLPELKALCEKTDVVFIVAGLGGGTATGAAPVAAKVAKEAGALVLGFVTLPFDCEGVRRQRQAQEGLEQLKAAADGVICLPNQKVFKLIDENTSLIDTFKITNDLLADGVRGIWQLLTRTGLIDIHFADLCAVLRGRHTESSFAAAEAMGANRSREVMEKMLAHPMFEGGQMLNEAEAVLVSLMGGPDLTMAEVNRVMEQINRQCENAQVIMGAAVDPAFKDRLSVTVVATRPSLPEKSPAATDDVEADERTPAPSKNRPGLESQFLSPSLTGRPASRFVAPPPELTSEKREQLLEQQATTLGRQRKKSSRMRQGQLSLEIISKGRFDKSEPTIHKGEDLDVPTYIRRGVALN
ncbi:MAG: cell division protein FtsZ [Verrucomicrobia bacterium]|nr:cell division protein FtsZ [Verrucomicrobiota bacterium]